MAITAIDHVAVPVQNVSEMLSFYKELGFSIRSSDDRTFPVHAAMLGDLRLNFHEPRTWQSQDFPRGPSALPGCGDFCFVWDGSIDDAKGFLTTRGITIELGPVERTGSRDGGRAVADSLYFRDPDRNLLELIVYRHAGSV